MIGGALSPNIAVLYVFRLLQGLALGALLVVLFAGFTEYVPGKNRGTCQAVHHSSATGLTQSATVLLFLSFQQT